MNDLSSIKTRLTFIVKTLLSNLKYLEDAVHDFEVHCLMNGDPFVEERLEAMDSISSGISQVKIGANQIKILSSHIDKCSRK